MDNKESKMTNRNAEPRSRIGLTRAETERFFGLPEGSLIETSEPLRYERRFPLPREHAGNEESDGRRKRV